MIEEMLELDVSALQERLSDVDDSPPFDQSPAAVLVPLLQGDKGWSMVFTRRSEDLPSHKGEISFPGGRVEPGETTRRAALRETQEELGVDPETVEVLGRLPEVFTFVSGYLVYPWVGVLASSHFSPNPSEIAEVITVPFDRLSSPNTAREQRFIRGGAIWIGMAYDVGDNIIWGATARILTVFLETIQ